jgi:hypothetical protein
MSGNRVPEQAPRTKKTYSSPRLVAYGDLQKLTMGNASVGNDPAPFNNTSRNPVCWIAEVLYGARDPRTHLMRAWLNTVYCRTLRGAVVVGLYRHFGRPIAAVAARHAFVRRIFRPLFDAGLLRAQAHFIASP